MKSNKTIFISVCKNVILSNLKRGTNNPPMRVAKGISGKPEHYHEYHDSKRGLHIYYGKPRPWGARVWIELTPL